MSEIQQNELIEYLETNGLDFFAWLEQPENIITAIALRPYNTEDIDSLLRFIDPYKLY